MSEVGTNERLLRSDVTLEESRKIERVLRRNNISYFEKWNFHTGVFKFLNNSKNSKCDIYVHMDSMDKAKELLADMQNIFITEYVSDNGQSDLLWPFFMLSFFYFV